MSLENFARFSSFAFLAIRTSFVTVFISIFDNGTCCPLFRCCLDRPFKPPPIRRGDWALPQLDFTTNCSDFHPQIISPSLFYSLFEISPRICTTYHPFLILEDWWMDLPSSCQIHSESCRGLRPRESSHTPYQPSIRVLFSPYMKKVNLSDYILFQGSIPSGFALRPASSFPSASSLLLPVNDGKFRTTLLVGLYVGWTLTNCICQASLGALMCRDYNRWLWTNWNNY